MVQQFTALYIEFNTFFVITVYIYVALAIKMKNFSEGVFWPHPSPSYKDLCDTWNNINNGIILLKIQIRNKTFLSKKSNLFFYKKKIYNDQHC